MRENTRRRFTRVVRILSARLTFLCLLPLAQTTMAAQGANFYCCKDDSGRQICADFVPSVCNSRGYRVVNSSGITIREVAAPLTAEQKAQKVAEERRLKEEKIAQREEERKDQALLDTYNSSTDIDAAQQREEDEIQRISSISKQQIGTLKVQQKVLLEEAEFYKNQELPANLSSKLRDIDRQIDNQYAIIKAQEKALASVRSRFAEEKRRYLEAVKRRK